jgi:hypothetical protein
MWARRFGVVGVLILCMWWRAHESSQLLSSSPAPYVLVHIPKTGGQSLRKLLHGGQCADSLIHEGANAHELTESRVIAAGKRPIVILREPLERLHSAFLFWRHGSEMPSLRALRSPQATLLLGSKQQMENVSFDLFL